MVGWLKKKDGSELHSLRDDFELKHLNTPPPQTKETKMTTMTTITDSVDLEFLFRTGYCNQEHWDDYHQRIFVTQRISK